MSKSYQVVSETSGAYYLYPRKDDIPIPGHHDTKYWFNTSKNSIMMKIVSSINRQQSLSAFVYVADLGSSNIVILDMHVFQQM